MVCATTELVVVLLYGGSGRFLMGSLFARCNVGLTPQVCVSNVFLFLL